MSWSFDSVGKPEAVAAKAVADLSRFKCPEPEETIKNKVLDILNEALSAFPEGTAVQVNACGSQYGSTVNSLTLSIKPLTGFVE